MVSNVTPTVLYIIVFIFGITVGSFLNVCILRIPAHESIVKGPSHCPDCGKQLKWYELIPLFSWLALRGRCSGCKGAISAQYPLIETANGALWVLCFALLGLSFETALACLLVSTLIVVAIIDARTMEIPPGTTITVLVLGVIATAIDYQNVLFHIIGFFAVSLPLYLVFAATKGRGIGGGDIKLMAGCGLFLGWKLCIFGFFAGCVIGTIIHLTLMAAKKAGRQLSFGPYLSIGIIIALLFGEHFINWYISLLA